MNRIFNFILSKIRSRFSNNQDRVYFNGNLNNKNTDPNSHKVLSKYYSKDESNAYYRKHIIPEADVSSFEVLSSYQFDNFEINFAKDAKHVFYFGNLIKNADPASFEVLSKYYSKDKKNAYYGFRPIPYADVYTFKIFSSKPDSYEQEYAKDSFSVFYRDEIITYADPNTFMFLSGYYSKDKRYVYFFNKIINGASVYNFKVLNSYYSRDEKNVYYRDGVLTGADPKTFEALKSKHDKYDQKYGRDSNSVYYHLEPIKDADPKTFEVLTNGYAKDKYSGYFDGKRIEESHGRSFKYAGSQGWDFNIDGMWGSFGFAKDKKFVYHRGEKIEGSHGSSFRLSPKKDKFNSHYDCIAEDKYSIYESGGSRLTPKKK